MASFLSLPIELRLEIYHYLLPNNETLTFRPSHTTHYAFRSTPPAYNLKISSREANISTNILYLNRQIYEEAKGVLYYENTFRFHVEHAPGRVRGCRLLVHDYTPNSARTFPMICPAAAKNIRRLELLVEGDLQYHGIYSDLSAWLEIIATTLSENNLEKLDVSVTDQSHYHSKGRAAIIAQSKISKQFCLEPLALLRGIENVTVVNQTAGAGSNFPHQLATVIASRDFRALPLVPYAEKVVFYKRPGRQRKSCSRIVSNKAWWDPIYVWAGDRASETEM